MNRSKAHLSRKSYAASRVSRNGDHYTEIIRFLHYMTNVLINIFVVGLSKSLLSFIFLTLTIIYFYDSGIIYSRPVTLPMHSYNIN